MLYITVGIKAISHHNNHFTGLQEVLFIAVKSVVTIPLSILGSQRSYTLDAVYTHSNVVLRSYMLTHNQMSSPTMEMFPIKIIGRLIMSASLTLKLLPPLPSIYQPRLKQLSATKGRLCWGQFNKKIPKNVLKVKIK